MARGAGGRMLASMSGDEMTTVSTSSLVPDEAPPREGRFVGAPSDELTVGEVMHPGVIIAAPESPLRYVARLMARYRVHAVVVIGDDEEGGIWGIVSDRDLLSAIARGELDEHTAGGMARTPVVTVSRSDSVEHAARVMSEHTLTHLLVLATGTHPVGVISTLDLARTAATDMVDPLEHTRPDTT
jgi:CBS domain-containing protein